MGRRFHITILSDIHYAGPLEQARGDDYEFLAIPNPLLRLIARLYRDWIWLRQPLRQGWRLDRFLAGAGTPDYVVANGDFGCDTEFVGVSEDGACESVAQCLGKLRAKFPDRFHATLGDHELGKLHLFGAASGTRLASWQRATGSLGIQPFWRLELGNWVLLGVTSTLLALPTFAEDVLPEEKDAWEKLRAEHLEQIRGAFASLRPEQRVLLFCHDPTALPYLWREEAVRNRLGQVEQTIIGHLHTNLVLWKSRLLAGMPVIRFMGHSVRKMSQALNEARHWRPFNVRLCPALAGIQLLKDGGWYEVELDGDAKEPAQFKFHPLRG
jgi:hypothetical protein